MQIQVKLFATHREYLPPGSQRGRCWVEADEGATAVSVLKQLGVPTDEVTSVVLVNGRSPAPGQLLQEGDVVSAFPAIAGG